MFRVIVGLEDICDRDTFVEAFRVFFDKIKEMIEAGTSWQALETTNFIVFISQDEDGKTRSIQMNFYQARDFAYEIGLMAGKGELQESVEEPPPDVIQRAFSKALGEHVKGEFVEAIHTLDMFRQEQLRLIRLARRARGMDI